MVPFLDHSFMFAQTNAAPSDMGGKDTRVLNLGCQGCQGAHIHIGGYQHNLDSATSRDSCHCKILKSVYC